MKRIRLFSLIIIVSLMLLVTCQLPSPANAAIFGSRNKTLTIWSFFPNKDMDALVKNYEAVHPKTKVIHTGYEFNALAPAFWRRASQGLGPDAVILTERELPALIKAGLVENLDSYDLDTTDWFPKSLISLRGLDQHLYGIPVAFQSMALCYNRSQVDTPPQTLNDLLEQSRNGIGVAFEAGFLKSMWGIGAFGGNFFNSANQFVLRESSLIRWLNWLDQAKQIPTIYFDHRPEILYNLFASGKVAYFPCWTFEYIPLKEQLGDDLAVASLPSATAENTSPYLETDALIINVHASLQQKKLALDFAQFMTQSDQQLAMISGAEHTVTPINSKTKVDKRLLSTAHVFAETAESAVAFPISDIYRLDRMRFYGDRVYKQVIQGIITPYEGVQKFFNRINNPPANEQIEVSTSAASDEVQEAVLVDIKPKINFLFDLFSATMVKLQRPVVILQLFLVAAVLFISWALARWINQWFKRFLD